MRDKMDENELRDIIKDCKKKMEPDALKTQDQQLPLAHLQHLQYHQLPRDRRGPLAVPWLDRV